jgi:ATP-binding cassette, subfamily B, bacterial PglK
MFNKLVTVYKFFDKKVKKRLFYSQLVILFTSFVEILSIFSIGPLVQILNNPNSIYEKDQFVSKVYDYFNFTSFENFVLFVVIVIFFLFLIAAITITFNLYLMTIFAQNLGNDIRSNLFKFYLSQPWLYHSKVNTSDLINKIIAETGRITNNVIFNILNTNSKLVTGFLIIIFLTIYNVKVSIIAISVLGTMYVIIFSFVKSSIEKHGENQSKYLSKVYRIMNESFLGIKETIIYGKQKKYFDDFSNTGKKWGLSIAKIHFFTLAPRNLLEFFAFSIVLIFIVLMIFNKQANFNDTLPAISIYIFAGYKLLPIFQSIYQGIAQLKGNIYAVDKIKFELNESKKYFFNSKKNETNQFTWNDDDVFKISNATFSYKDSDNAIKNINLAIKKNTLNFIVGPSGAGKSTLLDLILGLIFPKIGTVHLGLNQLNYENCKSWHKNLGYVGQNIYLIDDTIKKNICLNESEQEINEERFQNAINLSYVDKFLKDTPNGIETFVGERGLKLSGGQRQRIAIARALYQNKKFLILDEATASLDGIAEKFIIDQLIELSKSITIIMVTHNVKLCKNADMIYLLEDGSIKKSGNYDELLQESLFRKLLNE